MVNKMNINKDNIIEKLLENFHELKNEYKKELEWWNGQIPGLHIVFGNIFNPYIIELLKSNENDKKLKIIFNFLEELASSNDPEIKNVLTVTILEQLGDDPKILQTAQTYMKSKTRILSDGIEKYLGRLKNIIK